MTLFDELYAARMFPQLLVQFGEWLIYRPAGGVPRRIRAIVHRSSPEPVPGVPGSLAGKAEVSVYNNGATGISSATVDNGGDRLDIALRQGGDVTKRPIGRILSDTAGVLKFEVR